MHAKPMRDDEGEFGEWRPTKPENPDFKCRGCGSDDVLYRRWDSRDGAYEDLQYHCKGCGRKRWVESSDS